MEQPTAIATNAARHADLDWLRVIAVLLLVPFHTALIFLPDPGLVAYVKDAAQSDLLAQLKDFLDRWQLDLLFCIAGAAAWFALGQRSGRRYLIERVTRLLVPFVFGLLTLIPLMINFHWLGSPSAPSLGQIYARFFTLSPDLSGMSGTFTPAHLWFILYLFVFSLIALPLFLLLRRPSIQRGLAALARWPGSAYLFAIPLVLARSVELLGLGAKEPLYYLLLFVAGYVLASQPRFQAAVGRNLWLSLALALATTVLPRLLPPAAILPAATAQPVASLLYLLSQWAWVLTMLGAGQRWLNHESRGLRYAREAAYPFYILHLPVDTIVAFYVIQLDISLGAKFSLIVLATTLISLAIYDMIIKRVGLLRFCFGLKPLAHAALPRAAKHQPAH